MRSTKQSLVAISSALYCTQVSSFGVSQTPTFHQKTSNHVLSMKKSNNNADRRSFLTQAVISSGLIGTASTLGFVANASDATTAVHGHGYGCGCVECATVTNTGAGNEQHDSGCQCGQCLSGTNLSHPKACNCGACVSIGSNLSA